FSRIHARRRWLFMPEIVIVVTGAAANLGRFVIEQRNHQVIHHSLAFDAKIVDIVAEAAAHKWPSFFYACGCDAASGAAPGGTPGNGAEPGRGSATNHRASSNPTYLQMRSFPSPDSSKSPTWSGVSAPRISAHAAYSLSASISTGSGDSS